MERLRRRFQEDYQFAMIMLFGLLASIVIVGFSIYRFGTGNLAGGIVNLVIAASVMTVMLYSARSGDSVRAGRFFAAVTVLACIASAAMFGRTGILWGYLILWANFLLTGRQFALAANAVLILVMLTAFSLFDSAVEKITYAVTAILVTCFGYIFAQRLARYQQQLEDLALQDPLTYAGNRRMLKRDLTAAIATRRRTGQDYILILMDLDHFKEINDTQGHDAGDHALSEFADLVRSQIRTEDGLYRFGGEEFVVLLPGHGRANMREVAEQLHLRTSGRLEFGGMALRHSCGAAVLRDDEEWTAWLRRADLAMYQAKRAGRNRVEVAE